MKVCGLLSELPQIMLQCRAGHMVHRGHLQGGLSVNITGKKHTTVVGPLHSIHHLSCRSPSGGGEGFGVSVWAPHLNA